MVRPKCIARMTIRIPDELESDVIQAAMQRRCTASEIVISAVENELSRLATYRLDYYRDLRPLINRR